MWRVLAMLLFPSPVQCDWGFWAAAEWSVPWIRMGGNPSLHSDSGLSCIRQGDIEESGGSALALLCVLGMLRRRNVSELRWLTLLIRISVWSVLISPLLESVKFSSKYSISLSNEKLFPSAFRKLNWRPLPSPVLVVNSLSFLADSSFTSTEMSKILSELCRYRL